MHLQSASLAAVFASATLLAGPALASRSAALSTVVRDAPAHLGIVAALEPIREDRQLFRVQVKLDNGDTQTLWQERLNDVRTGDRVEIDAGQAFRHDSRAERIDRWGYRVDPAGNRYDDEGFRVADGERN